MFGYVQDGKLYATLCVARRFDEGARTMANTSDAPQFFIQAEGGRHDAIEVCNVNLVDVDEVDREPEVCPQSDAR